VRDDGLTVDGKVESSPALLKKYDKTLTLLFKRSTLLLYNLKLCSACLQLGK
jgi:hypothetical protein